MPDAPTPAPTPLRILHLEDSAIDADLISSYVSKGRKVAAEIRRVQTREEFLHALQEPWDLILADYELPSFDGLSALNLAREHAPTTPFIFVSGVLGEEFAVDSLRKGASDYVLKRTLNHLPGAIERAMTLGRERAERHRAEAEVRAARDAAEMANRAKDNFLAVLSHELRTPLTPILSTVEAWEADASVPAAMRESIAVIRRNVQLEARLIDDLLDLTRIARGKLHLHREKTNLHTIILHALDICRSQIQQKQLSLTLALDATRVTVDGDDARLQQVFWNLINNAVKFTPAGGRLAISTQDAWDNEVRAAVTDSGIGIAPQTLPLIFTAFEQGDVRDKHHFGGLGLGLAIAHAIVGRHGGHLVASSDGPGKGSTFEVTLPTLAQAAPQPAAPSRDVAPRPAQIGLNILLVEDHADSAAALSRLLRMSKHRVTLANNIRDGAALLGKDQFDVLISDLELPDGTGHELARLTDTRRTLTIAITGFGMDQDIASTRDAGFKEHLIKPVNFDKLNTVIDAYVQSRSRG